MKKLVHQNKLVVLDAAEDRLWNMRFLKFLDEALGWRQVVLSILLFLIELFLITHLLQDLLALVDLVTSGV